MIKIATFYIGYRPILAQDTATDWINTYTHKLGNYSNWQLMSTAPKPLTGAPDLNRTPGGGAYDPTVRVYGEGDVFLSRVFLGLEVPWKNSLKGAANPIQNDFYGRYTPDLYRGLTATRVFSAGFGHTSYDEVTNTGGGVGAAYALWSNYYWVGVGNNKVLQTNVLGHKERYPLDTVNPGTLGLFNEPTGPAESFGAFEPYIYKGLVTERSRPLGDQYNTGHPYWENIIMPDQMPQDYGEIPPPRTVVNHYGDDRVREYHGLNACRALAV